MQYGREYERQADLLGAQILARAGYDPREMANMFRTIEKEGGGGGPEWMSSHPNPGNRYNAIINEAKSLRVQGNANTGQFQSIQARLGGMSPALTAEQIAKGQARPAAAAGPSATADATVRVDPPATSYRHASAGQFLRVSVPSNWDEVERAGRRDLRAGRRVLPRRQRRNGVHARRADRRGTGHRATCSATRSSC